MENQTGVDQTTEEVVNQEVAAPESGVESTSPVEAIEGAEIQEVSKDEAGKLDTIKAERDRRQVAEIRSRILEEELKQIRNQVPQPQKKQPFEGLADDDVVQVGHVKEYLGEIRNEFREEFQRQRIETSTRIAKKNYNDYDEVIGKLTQVANQNQIMVILSGNDPAESAYWFVKSSPRYIDSLTQKVKEDATRQTIDSINQHTKKPKTLSSAGGGKMDAKSIIRSMSQEEYDKLVNDITQGKTRNDVFGK